MRQLPEMCKSCSRQIQTLEMCVVLGSEEEKRAGEVTFLESVSQGVLCSECARQPAGEAPVSGPAQRGKGKSRQRVKRLV